MVLYQKAGQITIIKLYTEEENGLKKESETDKVWSTLIIKYGIFYNNQVNTKINLPRGQFFKTRNNTNYA